MIPDELFEQILSDMWDSFAIFSHESFLTSGRGTIALNLPSSADSLDELEVMYVVYDYEAGEPDADVAKMLRSYNPKQEMIIQFLQPTRQVRTVRAKAPNQESAPEQLWLEQSAFGGAFREEAN